MLLFFVNFYYFIIGGCQLAKYMVNSNSDCPGRAEGTLFITEVFFINFYSCTRYKLLSSYNSSSSSVTGSEEE